MGGRQNGHVQNYLQKDLDGVAFLLFSHVQSGGRASLDRIDVARSAALGYIGTIATTTCILGAERINYQ